MKKIQLTEAEIKTIEAYKNDEINTYSPENPEDQKNLDSVINKAEEIFYGIGRNIRVKLRLDLPAVFHFDCDDGIFIHRYHPFRL